MRNHFNILLEQSKQKRSLLRKIFFQVNKQFSARNISVSEFFYIEIQSELDELNIKKIYLFDPPQTSKTKPTSGADSEISSSEPVQLYEQFEGCSIEPPKPIPYNPKRMSTSVESSPLSSFVLRNHRSCFLHLYIWNNRITKSSSDQTRQVRIILPLPILHH